MLEISSNYWSINLPMASRTSTKLLTGIDGVYYTTNDQVSAYNQTPLSEDIKKLTSFVVGGNYYMFERRFYGICAVQISLVESWQSILLNWLQKKQAFSYIDDVILQANTKAEMRKNLDFNFQCLRSSGLKAAPNKTKLWEMFNSVDTLSLTKESKQPPKRYKAWKIWRALKTRQTYCASQEV